MERINDKKPSGVSGRMLRVWGMIFITLGVFGRGILQGKILGIGTVTGAELLEIMNSSNTAMGLASLSLVLQAVETCAVPIFAMLLVEGALHTSGMKQYTLRVLGLALIVEIPYNWVITGKLLNFGELNPVFGVLLSLIMLWFYQRFGEKSAKNTAIKAVVTFAAILWAQMLSISFGAPMVILTAVVWFMRRWPNYRGFVGAAAAMVCTLISPFFLAAPMGFLVVHMYNGEPGELSRPVKYLAYPVILLAVGIVRVLW